MSRFFPILFLLVFLSSASSHAEGQGGKGGGPRGKRSDLTDQVENAHAETLKDFNRAVRRYIELYDPRNLRVALDRVLGKLVLQDLPDDVSIQVPTEAEKLVSSSLKTNGLPPMKNGVLTGAQLRALVEKQAPGTNEGNFYKAFGVPINGDANLDRDRQLMALTDAMFNSWRFTGPNARVRYFQISRSFIQDKFSDLLDPPR